MTPTRRQQALEKDAAVRLARFERQELWNGLTSGEAVKITGHRGGTWVFQAFVTNTSNGASWVEVLEVVADGYPSRITRVRSFRPELVTPVKKRRTRRRAPETPAVDDDSAPIGVQPSLFDD